MGEINLDASSLSVDHFTEWRTLRLKLFAGVNTLMKEQLKFNALHASEGDGVGG